MRQHYKSEHWAPCRNQTPSWYDWKIVESDVKPEYTHTHTHTPKQNAILWNNITQTHGCQILKQRSQLVRWWYLSHRWSVEAQVSLHIRAVSPEPSLFAHMKYGSRWKVRPKIRHLARLDEFMEVSLHIPAVSPEPSLFAHMKYGSRRKVRPKYAYLSHIMTKPTKWLFVQWKLRSAWASAKSDQSLCCALNG